MAKKKIDNKANRLSLTEEFLEESGHQVPQKENENHIGADSSWTRFTVICNSELVEKIKAIAQKEGFTIREVVEKFFKVGIGNYEKSHGLVKIKAKKKKNIDEVFNQ